MLTNVAKLMHVVMQPTHFFCHSHTKSLLSMMYVYAMQVHRRMEVWDRSPEIKILVIALRL